MSVRSTQSGVAVVTGAGRGIGRAVALELARAGMSVGLQARDGEALEAVAREVRELGAAAWVVPGDVTDPDSARRLVDGAEAELGPVDAAVACAGQARSAPLLRTTEVGFRDLFEVNTLAVFHLLKQSAGGWKRVGRKGRFVVVASTAGLRGSRYTAAYTASKHATLGLVKTAAVELAPHGITVNAICPGWVDTPLFADALDNIAAKTGGSREEAKARIVAGVPLGRILTPEEVAGAVRFLLGPAAGHVTGQSWVMDGGEGL
jgi:NAD(P)-dependent dehydrogenase (short-subunit alcohol dehydrogenase family)